MSLTVSRFPPYDYVKDSSTRTTRWAERGLKPINRNVIWYLTGADKDLRIAHARYVLCDFLVYGGFRKQLKKR